MKINFRGEDISRLEAKILIFNLKVGVISTDLNEQEKKDYEAQKELKNYFDSLLKKQDTKEFSEKEYLIGKLNSKLKLSKLAENIEYCQKHGHISNPQCIINGTKSFNICKRCRRAYTRGLNIKDTNAFYKLIHRPFTI